MKFFIILLCLMLERYLNLGDKLHRFNWLPFYIQQMHQKLGDSIFWRGNYQAIVTLVFPVLFITGVVYYFVGYYSLPLKFLLGTFIFLYCLGPYDLYHQANGYLKVTTHSSPNETVNSVVPESATAIFWQANESMFAVIFWFMILGPLGAIIYRMLVLISQLDNRLGFNADVSKKIVGILDWLPVRLTAFGYAVAGNFKQAFGYWIDYMFSGFSFNQALLTECGHLALQTEAMTDNKKIVHEALVLIDKTTIIYLVVIAIIELIAFLLLFWK